MPPWVPGEGRQRRLQRSSTRDRLLVLLKQPKPRKRNGSALGVATFSDREDSNLNTASSVEDFQPPSTVPPPEGAVFNSNQHRENHKEGRAMEDDFSLSISPSATPLPMPMITRHSPGKLDDTFEYSCPHSTLGRDEVGRAREIDLSVGRASIASGPFVRGNGPSATVPVKATETSPGESFAARERGGSGVSWSGMSVGGAQALDDSTHAVDPGESRREPGGSFHRASGGGEKAGAFEDSAVVAVASGEASAEVAIPPSTYEGGCSMSCLEESAGSISRPDPRPSPLAIVGMSGSGVRSAGTGPLPTARAGQQQVSPSSVPPSPTGGGGGSIGMFPMGTTTGNNGAEPGALPPPVARRSSRAPEEGRAGGQQLGGFSRKYAAEATSGGRLIARGVGSNKGSGPPSAGSISTASNSSPTASRSGASTPDLRLPYDLPPSLEKRSPSTVVGSGSRGTERGQHQGKTSATASSSATPPRQQGHVSTKAPLFPRPGLLPTGGSNSSSAASTPAARAGGVRLAPFRRHRLSRSDSVGVWNPRTTRAHHVSSWPSRSWSSCSTSLTATPSAGSGGGVGGGRGSRVGSPEDGIRGIGIGIAGALAAGRRVGKWRGGRRKGEFFRAEEDTEDGIIGGPGGVGGEGFRERSYSDSEALSTTIPCETAPRTGVREAGRLIREHRYRSGGGGGGGADDHYQRRGLSKLRNAKLLPSAVSWPGPLSLQRRTGRSRPPPPDDAMVSPPPSCVLYGEDPIEAMGIPSRGSGGISLDRKLTVRSASFGGSHGWATPLFRQNRRGKRGGSGGRGIGASTPMNPALVPPSPAGLLDMGHSLDALQYPLDYEKPSDRVVSGSMKTGFMKLPSLLALQEARAGDPELAQERGESQPQHGLSSAPHGGGTAASSPASSAGCNEPADYAAAAESGSGGGIGLGGPARFVGSSTTTAVVHSAGTQDAMMAPLHTPSQAKPSKTEPPRPPGRPPHAQRRHARQRQRRRGPSRVAPWDSSDEQQPPPPPEIKESGSCGGVPPRRSRPPKASSRGGACGEVPACSPPAPALAGGGVGGSWSGRGRGEGTGRRKVSIAPVLLSPPASSVGGMSSGSGSGSGFPGPSPAAARCSSATDASTSGGGGQPGAIGDEAPPAARGDADEVDLEVDDAVSVIGQAVLDHLMLTRSCGEVEVCRGREEPTPTWATTHGDGDSFSGDVYSAGDGGRCGVGGGFFPPSAESEGRAVEGAVDEGFLTARGEKSFFALDGDSASGNHGQQQQERSHEYEHQQHQQKDVLQQEAGETEQASTSANFSVVEGDACDEGDDRRCTESGLGSVEEGASPLRPEDEDELFAEAVLEEFTVDAGVDNEGSEDYEGEGLSKAVPRDAPYVKGNALRRPMWEALLFSKGVFHHAARSGTKYSSWTGIGDPVPCPPGICLVDQAKELQARRLYEIGQALGRKRSATLSHISDHINGQADEVKTLSPIASNAVGVPSSNSKLKTKREADHDQQGSPGQSTAEMPRVGAGGNDHAAGSGHGGTLREKNGNPAYHYSPALAVGVDSPARQTASDAPTQGEREGGYRSDRSAMEPGVASSSLTNASGVISSDPRKEVPPAPAVSKRENPRHRDGCSHCHQGGSAAASVSLEAFGLRWKPSAAASGTRCVHATHPGRSSSPPQLPPRPTAAAIGAVGPDASGGPSSTAVKLGTTSAAAAAAAVEAEEKAHVGRRKGGAEASEKFTDVEAAGAKSIRARTEFAAVSPSASPSAFAKMEHAWRGDALVSSPPPITNNASSLRLAAAAKAAAARLTSTGTTTAGTSIRMRLPSAVLDGRTSPPPAIGRPRGTVDDPCEVVVADAVRVISRADVVLAPAVASSASEGVGGGVRGAAQEASSSSPLLAAGAAAAAAAKLETAAAEVGRESKEVESPPFQPAFTMPRRPLETTTAGLARKALAANLRKDQSTRQGRQADASAAAEEGDDAPTTSSQEMAPVLSQERSDMLNSSVSSVSDAGESFHSALSRIGSSSSVSPPAAPTAAAATAGISNIGGIDADLFIGQIGCSRSAYRPRGVSYGEKPWRAPDAKGAGAARASATSSFGGGFGEAGVFVYGEGEKGGKGGGFSAGESEGYRPGNGQGLMVSSGVVLEADVRVPQGTVGVTRGGELKGRVVAKEFLLEDGGRLDGDVECDFAVIEGYLKGSLVSREVSTIGPSALFDGDVIYNVLELDKGAVITGRLFSIRSTASNVLQDQDRPVTDANIIKQRRLQHELRQRQRVGQRGLDAPAPSSRLDYDYDDDDRSKENPSLTGVDRRIVAAGSSKPSPVKTLMTSSMTSSMASLLMSGERRAFSGSDISGGSNKNASARRGEDDISGISGAAKGGFGALSGLWGTMLEGMAWARALSDAPAAAAAATSAATNNSTASAHQLEEEHPRHRSGDHSGERFQQSSIRDAKIKQVWIRAAERRAQIA